MMVGVMTPAKLFDDHTEILQYQDHTGRQLFFTEMFDSLDNLTNHFDQFVSVAKEREERSDDQFRGGCMPLPFNGVYVRSLRCFYGVVSEKQWGDVYVYDTYDIQTASLVPKVFNMVAQTLELADQYVDPRKTIVRFYGGHSHTIKSSIDG